MTALLERATQLMVELAAVRPRRALSDVYPGKIERKPIKISVASGKTNDGFGI